MLKQASLNADARVCGECSTRERPVRVHGGAGCAAMAWLGLYGFAWNDYDTEARPAFDALVHGHALEFLRLALPTAAR